jgi:hypothetical protein
MESSRLWDRDKAKVACSGKSVPDRSAVSISMAREKILRYGGRQKTWFRPGLSSYRLRAQMMLNASSLIFPTPTKKGNVCTGRTLRYHSRGHEKACGILT